MITLYKYEGKNKQELSTKYLEELNVTENDIFIKEIEDLNYLKQRSIL